ncbi:catalase [Yoonia sp.]|uniref:catalase n=1 Tax=Yoonia sp. TaxID=2212373 RepID=UPI003919E62D
MPERTPNFHPTIETQSDEKTTTRGQIRGNGGETHQQPDQDQYLTTANGTPVSDNQNSLRAGPRGAGLLEDFAMREKIFHFDHERIPERVVHARGYGAHGYFETTKALPDVTAASLFQQEGERVPAFVRFSTVAGNKGSMDLARDVRGFAVKLYTQEGNWDIVGNNIPVFFIQDAIKFPDLIHSVKDEPDRGFPQAQSAHDNFWDFISLMPEAMHMVMWQMSDRAIPRSFRFMEGFGVHSFRFVNPEGKGTFVKFHWKPRQGLQSVLWDEAVKINGADPDFHRRDLWTAIETGDYPEWDLAVQLFDDDFADAFDFDVLDPTKIIPEEEVPLQIVGRLVLNRNVDNFFTETEQVAFCTQNIVPGVDFTNDPLLQGRNFSYLDTQLKRLGGPNFTQIPINAPRCPMHHFQQDGHMQTRGPSGRANYEPNSWEKGGPRADPQRGHRSFPEEISGEKRKIRPESFADHYSQARQFYISQTSIEQDHIADALVFELSKVETPQIRERLVAHLPNIDTALAEKVATGLGMAEVPSAHAPAVQPDHGLKPSDALSILKNGPDSFKGRKLGVLVTDGIDGDLLDALMQSFTEEGAMVALIATKIGGITTAQGQKVPADHIIDGAPSVLFDAVAILATEAEVENLQSMHPVRNFVADAVAHAKFIAFSAAAESLVLSAQDDPDAGMFILSDVGDAAPFVQACGALRFWDRIS